METRNNEQAKLSKPKLQKMVGERVCQNLSFAILNLDFNMEKYKDKLNPNCPIYEQKDLVNFYAKAYPFHVGHEIRRAINLLFSCDELIDAHETEDYTHIYKGIYNYLAGSSEPGLAGVHRTICLLIDYKLNGFIEEVKE